VHDYLHVLVSIVSEQGAHALQRLLLEQPPTAWAQILCPIASAYWRRGQIEQAQEWLCLTETRCSQYHRLKSLVRENHPCDTPEILAILTGYASYLY
jgi:periplasmic divalent cation tolerance protein